ncbi:PAS domain S-box protein [Geobacter sp. FeAm09]|uniref:PAS domain S-box protein n=1 Tax=Geobacter sp. FeAm09 TaxID=2597769 RepID=UPI0011ED844B|nr:PAS domain S-box protein [Geobacter sp. FeAm09]QEM69018.1 PAS domain S-box protein [Geobacter sp. FeAm09]
MDISRKTILVIVSTFIGLVFILAITSDFILLNSFAKLENKLLGENIAKMKYELREGLADMESCARDYVTLVQGRGPREIGALDTDSLVNHHVDFVAVFSAAGELLSAKSADYHFRRPTDFDDALARCLGKAALFAIKSKDRHLSGSIRNGTRLHQVVALPCSGGGVLLVGRNMDREEIARLSDINEFALEVRQVRDEALSADFREALAVLGDGAPFHAVPLDESRIAGYALFNDIDGQPLFIAKLTERRLLYQQGRASITYILAALCIAGFVFCCVMLFFVRGTVLKRLGRLSATVRQISHDSDISSRLKVTEHNDELDDLALTINGMLESLERAEATLREREEQYRILFERAPDSILLLGTEGDEAGRIMAANKASAIQHGCTVEELCTMNIRDLTVPESSAAAGDWMERIFSGQWITFEVWHFRRDGARFPLEVHAGPVRLNGKNYILGFDRDITSRKLAEETDHMYMEQIRQLNTELARQANGLEAANSELEAFNYSVSHDLRGPLTRISGYSQLILEDEAALDPQTRSYATRIYESCCWLNEMIDAMLRLAQLARSEFQPQQVDLSAIVESLSIDFRAAEPERRPEVVIAPGLTVVGDLRLLKILLTNLFGNAWKYTAHSAAPRIEFGALHNGPVPVFFISDTGAGFDMKDVDRLFRVFTRLHDPAQFAGNGIGLATVQRIVNRHGGRIWAEGEPRKGAAFYFTLQPDNPTASRSFAS